MSQLPDVEVVSASVHAAWMESKRAQGVTSRMAEDGEELMVPYLQLSEKAKQLDSASVQTVYAAIAREERDQAAPAGEADDERLSAIAAVLRELVELKAIKRKIDAACATGDERERYRLTKHKAWLDAEAILHDSPQSHARQSGESVPCYGGKFENRPYGGEGDEIAVCSICNQAAGDHRDITARPATPLLTLDTAERVCFYEQEFYVLSNFSAFTLLWKGRLFQTSEHAYHWEKFAVGHRHHAAEIMGALSAHDALKYAERHKADRRPDWDDVKIEIMLGILRAKAEQHEYVRRKLLETGERELVENSWRDSFWGWGPDRDGMNMLGTLWMKVRAELRRADGGGA
jgi:ribA/ribD-fused uncharacterized protein